VAAGRPTNLRAKTSSCVAHPTAPCADFPVARSLLGLEAMRSNLLIVEDHESGRLTMGEYFEAIGYSVTLARDVQEALDRIASGPFAIVITDLRLSPFSPAEGLDVVAAARARLPGAAILVVTAYANPEIVERARRLGADVVLHKPQSLDTLAELASSLVVRRAAG